jgi:hypothetical protein
VTPMRNKFAKRHYEAIAEAMQEAKRTTQSDRELKGVIYAINELADVFAQDNGMFKRDRFYCACQVGANVRARS